MGALSGGAILLVAALTSTVLIPASLGDETASTGSAVRLGDPGWVPDEARFDPAVPDMAEWARAGVQGGVPERTDVAERVSPGESIQAAVDRAGQSGGGVVVLEAGDHRVGQTIQLRDGVVLRGADRDGTRIVVTMRNEWGGDSNKVWAVELDGVADAGIEDLTFFFDVPGYEPVYPGNWGEPVTDSAWPWELDMAEVDGPSTEVHTRTDLYVGFVRMSGGTRDSWIQDTTMLEAGTDPIHLESSTSHLTMRGNVVDGCYNKGPQGNCYYDIRGEHVLVTGERVMGIRHVAPQLGARYVVLVDNHFETDVNFHQADDGHNLVEGNVHRLPEVVWWPTIGAGNPGQHPEPGPGNLAWDSDIQHLRHGDDFTGDDTVWTFRGFDLVDSGLDRPAHGTFYAVRHESGATVPDPAPDPDPEPGADPDPVTDPEPTPDPAPAPGGDQPLVTLYEHVDFEGASLSFATPGVHADVDSSWGALGDAASSIELAPGVTATACDHPDGTGECRTFTESDHWVRTLNDDIEWLDVTAPPGWGQGGGDDPGAGDPPAGDPLPADDCDVVAFEAESLALTGSWAVREDPAASGGSYITWEGLAPQQNTTEPTDVIEAQVSVSTPGTYRFTWAMRQPDGVDSDKGNDSWLNVPDAARFGPVDGGSYGGFVKVFGNATGTFAYRATADVDHEKTQIAAEFPAAGTYTVQIAGRSHGHQIDRVVLYPEGMPVEEAVAADCGSEPSAPPTPGAPTVPDGAPLDPTVDLVSLHYDHAPDRDDGHAAVAAREVTADLGITPHVVSGAYGENRDTYQPEAEAVMRAAWGSDWVDAHGDWSGAVAATTRRWQAVLDGGGDVWVAEGGQSDFTADVVRELVAADPGLDTRSRIHVVQHSQWNEDQTTDGDLQYVRDVTDYISIPDGNADNGTANLNQRSDEFVRAALAGQFGSAWEAAFDYLDPDSKLDFSDTVELLHIVGVGRDVVADVDDFADVYIR